MGHAGWGEAALHEPVRGAGCQQYQALHPFTPRLLLCRHSKLAPSILHNIYPLPSHVFEENALHIATVCDRAFLKQSSFTSESSVVLAMLANRSTNK